VRRLFHLVRRTESSFTNLEANGSTSTKETTMKRLMYVVIGLVIGLAAPAVMTAQRGKSMVPDTAMASDSGTAALAQTTPVMQRGGGIVPGQSEFRCILIQNGFPYPVTVNSPTGAVLFEAPPGTMPDGSVAVMAHCRLIPVY
jgi:hypothetical protein